MIRRFAAIFGLISFAGATLIGVLTDVSPLTRVGRSLLAMTIGLLIGAVAGSMVQRLVLARFAEEIPEDVGGDS